MQTATALGSAPAHPSPLARYAIIAFAVLIGVALAILILSAWLLVQHQLTADEPVHLGAVHAMGFWTLMARLIVLKPVFVWLWWTRLLLTVTANGLFIAWLYSTYKRLQAQGATLRFAPHWAITGFFVPFLNFARPYQVVKDAWVGASRHRANSANSSAPVPLVIHLWWAFTLATVVLVTFGGRAMQPGFLELTPVFALALLGAIGIATTSALVIDRIERAPTRQPAAPITVIAGRPAAFVLSGGAVTVAVIVCLAVYGYTYIETPKVIRMFQGGMSAETLQADVPPEWAAAAMPTRRPPEPPPESAVARDLKPIVPVEIEPQSHLKPIPAGPVEGGVTGGIEGGVPGGAIGGIAELREEAPPPPSRSAPKVIRLSGGVAMQNRTSGLPPAYPPIARTARVQGTVLLDVMISPEGRVEQVRAVSGHPLLTQSAINAVKSWRFKPYMLNGRAVAVATAMPVNFRLE